MAGGPSPMRIQFRQHSECPRQPGRPGRLGQDDGRQKDLQNAVSMTKAGVDLTVRHALDRTRATAGRERVELP